MGKNDEMNDKERFLNALLLKKIDRASAACPLQTATTEMMDETGCFWPDANYDSKKMAMLAEFAHTKAGIESIRVPFDLCVEAEVLGAEINQGRKNSQPSVIKPAIRREKDLDVTFKPDPKNDGRMKTVCDAVSILSEKYSDVPIIAGITGPFTLAGQIRGVEMLLMDFFDNPDFVKTLLNYTTEVLIDFAKALTESGADSIIVIDPSAGCELLGKKHYESMALPYCKKLIDSIKVPTILHICGDTTPILEKMCETNADAISLDHLVDMKTAFDTVGNRICLIGNINPADTLFLGSTEDVKNETKECIKAGARIIAPGCGIPTGTKIENIKAWIETVKEE